MRLHETAIEVSRSSRARKLAMILDLLPAKASVLALGVEGDGGAAEGGYDTGNQIEKGLRQAGHEVTALAFGDAPRSLLQAGCVLVRGDARALPFTDGAFDLVLSNAVVEHVGGPEGATAVIEESRRVAKVLTIHTTPNRWFPVETHTRVPVLHWLPRTWHPRMFGNNHNFRWSDAEYLFSRRTFLALSPDGQMAGGWPRRWPISLIALWPARSTRSAAGHGRDPSCVP